MKRILLTYLPAAACMLMLTACSGRSVEAMPAVSPNLDMRTAHVFSNDTGLCDVTVDEVFEGTQPRETKTSGRMMDYIVAACTVKHIFHQEVEPFEENWLNEDDSILIWIETARLSEQDMVDFTVLLEEVDSLIVFGTREDVELVKDSPECLSFWRCGKTMRSLIPPKERKELRYWTFPFAILSMTLRTFRCFLSRMESLMQTVSKISLKTWI